MTPFERLLAEVPPPEKRFAAEGDWERVEHELGLALPSDYKTFISTYGSGMVCNFVWIHSPFNESDGGSLVPSALNIVAVYDSYLDTEVIHGDPFPFYPKAGGMLPIGSTENANYLNWLTEGPPDEWDLVVWDPDFLRFQRTGYKSLVGYLADVVQQLCGVVPGDPPSDWFDPPRTFTAIDFDNLPRT